MVGRSLPGWLVAAILAAVLVVAPFVLPTIGANADMLSRILIWGIFGLGFDLIFGYTGLLSFGQSAFYGSGGFLAAYLLVSGKIGDVFLGLAVGTVGGALVGLVIGALALRRTGIYLAMITVAFGEMFFFLENSPLSAWTGGENGLPNVPKPAIHLGPIDFAFNTDWRMYGFIAAIYFLGFILARRIVNSPFGHILTAIRDNAPRARAVGHAVQRYKLAVFVIAAAYAGLAGGLEGVLQGYMAPDAFTFDTSGQLVMQTIIGGPATLFGPLIGAAVWLYLRSILQVVGFGPAWKLVLGLVFVVLIVFLRHGIVGGILQFAGRRTTPEAIPTSSGAQGLHLVERVAERPATRGDVVLEARGVGKRYGGIIANSDISFAVAEGEIRGIIGPNGAGKSTFFKMLTGEILPTAGRIFLFGKDITGNDVTAISQQGLSKSYQINQLFQKLTVRQNLNISALSRTRGKFRLDLIRHVDEVPELNADVAETLRLLSLTERADAPVSELAYGEKRRLEIGLALGTGPRILLLDEPLAGMSPQERADTVKLLKQIARGRTLVIVEHDMDALFGMADRITVFNEGHILAEGTPAEIQANPGVQEAYLGGVHAA
ncbi:MAG TPA: branched-chain amino acid ABC transporter ATP-binding protein/permease [Bauldia sp.]